MGRLIFLLILFFPAVLHAFELPLYQIKNGNRPVRVTSEQAATIPPSFSQETLKVRVLVKKFYVSKTDQGSSVRFEVVCEENSRIDVEDLTNGGGVIQERLIVACQSTHNGHQVAVAVSGMIYDNLYGNFSDENREKTRNFMTHLQLHSQGSPVLYGIGDFNLGYTRDLPFRYWVSELSTDAAGGKANAIGVDSVREGFVASVRYGND